MQKKIMYIFVIFIIMLMCFLGCITYNRELLNKNIKLASIKNEDINLLTYEIKDWNSPDDIKLLIKVTSENGLEYIKVPEENVISAQGNNALYIDFSIKVNEEKTFVIKEKEKDEKEETILITEEEFVSLLTDQPSVSVSNITTTGYDLSYSLVDRAKPYVDSITYYLGESETDESPMVNTTGVVTELSDYTKKYVWAEVTYKYGSATKNVKSKNYRIAYTSHVHDASCYSNIYHAIGTYDMVYKSAWDDTYKDMCCRITCSKCYHTQSYRKVSWWPSDVNDARYMDTCITYNYHDINVCHSCQGFGGDYDWTTNEITVYPRRCKECARPYMDTSTNKYDGSLLCYGFKCRHNQVSNDLICTKPETGYSMNYYF